MTSLQSGQDCYPRSQSQILWFLKPKYLHIPSKTIQISSKQKQVKSQNCPPKSVRLQISVYMQVGEQSKIRSTRTRAYSGAKSGRDYMKKRRGWQVHHGDGTQKPSAPKRKDRSPWGNIENKSKTSGSEHCLSKKEARKVFKTTAAVLGRCCLWESGKQSAR